jgi:hypothetical protein
MGRVSGSIMFLSNQHSPAEILVDFAFAAASGYKHGLPVDPHYFFSFGGVNMFI